MTSVDKDLMEESTPTELGGWQIVALLEELVELPVKAMLGDDAIVVFRTGSGRVGAFLDVCPHKGFPMSTGKVTEEGLKCGFHDYTFSPEGRCIAVRRGDPDDVAWATQVEVCRHGDLVLARREGYDGPASWMDGMEPDRVSAVLAELSGLGDVRWGRTHCAQPHADGRTPTSARRLTDLVGLSSGGDTAGGTAAGSLCEVLAHEEGERRKGVMVDVPGADYAMYAGSVWSLDSLGTVTDVMFTMPAIAGDGMLNVLVRTPPLQQGADHSHLYAGLPVRMEGAEILAVSAAVSRIVGEREWTDVLNGPVREGR